MDLIKFSLTSNLIIRRALFLFTTRLRKKKKNDFLKELQLLFIVYIGFLYFDCFYQILWIHLQSYHISCHKISNLEFINEVNMELMIHKTLSKHLCYVLRKTHIRENSGPITLNVKLQVLSLLFMLRLKESCCL